VYVIPFGGRGGKWQISSTGDAGPAWRRDGKSFFTDGYRDKTLAIGSNIERIGDSDIPDWTVPSRQKESSADFYHPRLERKRNGLARR
jgi:hypothetical protein